MLRLEVLRAKMSIKDSARVRAFIQELRSGWTGVVGTAQAAQRAALGVDETWDKWGNRLSSRAILFSEARMLVDGEYFAVEHGAVAVAFEGDTRELERRFYETEGDIDQMSVATGFVEVSLLTYAEHENYKSRVLEAAKEHLNVDLEVSHVRNRQFDELRTELVAEDIPVSEAILTAARALTPRSHRDLAVAIKSARGLLVADIEKRPGLTKAKAKEALAQLTEAGVIESEVVVVCGSTGNQVARVQNADQLATLGEQGLRCGCGKPISDETPDKLYSVTETGTTLIDKSRWMSVLVRQSLVEMGVPENDILLECLVGSDEIDCLALISGQTVIFELKDKEFSLGNAYSFGAKVSIIQPSHAVIVTTEHTPDAVREHFNRTQSLRGVRDRGDRREFHYLVGENFLNQLAPIVAALYRLKTDQVLSTVFSLTSPQASAVLDMLDAADA